MEPEEEMTSRSHGATGAQGVEPSVKVEELARASWPRILVRTCPQGCRRLGHVIQLPGPIPFRFRQCRGKLCRRNSLRRFDSVALPVYFVAVQTGPRNAPTPRPRHDLDDGRRPPPLRRAAWDSRNPHRLPGRKSPAKLPLLDRLWYHLARLRTSYPEARLGGAVVFPAPSSRANREGTQP